MRVGILVVVRLKSLRLPMKSLKPVNGRPMLSWQLDRLKLAERPEEIIICTSTLPEDDPLEELAERESVHCYRGHPEDVLLRITEAARKYEIDIVVGASGDNPLTDPDYLDRLVDFHIDNGNDFSKIQGLPIGTYTYVLSYPAMEHACRIKDTEDSENYTVFFTELDVFKDGMLLVDDKEIARPDLRLTVDYPEDFELVRNIISTFAASKKRFALKDIIRFCDDHPELSELNKSLKQRDLKPLRVKTRKQWNLAK